MDECRESVSEADHGSGHVEDCSLAEQGFCAGKFYLPEAFHGRRTYGMASETGGTGACSAVYHLRGERAGDGCSPGGIKTSTETGDREIGSVYLRDIDRERETAEYGIFIGEEDALGCGYGVQAAKLMLQYGFETLHLESIFLRVLEDNAGARKSYEKAGFQRIENRRESVQLEQGVRYVLFMEVKRSTWEKTKNNLGAV